MELPVNQIMNGDALTHLKKLPDQSINMVMTSPPYWGLRDYGTAKWIGGNSECDHKIPDNEKDPKSPNAGSHISRFNRECCYKCGAKRIDSQIGLEPTFQDYIIKLCDIFDEVKRIIRNDGTLWINMGDTYSAKPLGSFNGGGSIVKGRDMKGISTSGCIDKTKSNVQEKSLCNIPARFSIEMQNRGWILRNVIIWHKPSCLPSPVKDRFTVDFEYIFFFSKNKDYYFKQQIENTKAKVIEPRMLEEKRQTYDEGKYKGEQGVRRTMTRNMRSVWSINPKPFLEAHFATYPEGLCETPISAGCPEGGIVLDMFFGAGTTGLVALKQNKKFIGIELNPSYIKIAQDRINKFANQQKLDALEDRKVTDA